MAKLPCIHFYPGDWLRDQVSGCSLAAQGLWFRMMMLMHDSDRYGYLSMNGVAIPPEHVARRCGVTPEQYTTLLAELDSVGVPRRNSDGIIYSKRMVDDAKLREIRAKSGSKGGKQKSSKIKANGLANTEDEVEDENEVKNDVLLQLQSDPPKTKTKPWDELVSAWNALGKPFPRCLKFVEERQRQFRDRSKDDVFNQHWRAALEWVKKDGFCRGSNGWVANIEWFLRPGTVLGIAEKIDGSQQNSALRIRKPSTHVTYEGAPI